MPRMFSEDHIQNKKEFLDKAMELYGITAPAFDKEVDHVAEIIKVAERIEAYVFSDMKSAKAEQVDDKAAADIRRAFLDSIAENTCGRGREDCNGSEGTCTCQ